MNISSSVLRKLSIISLFTAKLLPLPGTPKKSPFGFFNIALDAVIIFCDNEFNP